MIKIAASLLFLAACGPPESFPSLPSTTPSDASHESSTPEPVPVPTEAAVAMSIPPWNLYTCYYGVHGFSPPDTVCAAGQTYVSCVIGMQPVGFCDSEPAICRLDVNTADRWVCPAGTVTTAATHCLLDTTAIPKFPQAYVYNCPAGVAPLN